MNALVAQVAVAVGPLPVPVVMKPRPGQRRVRRRAKPQVVVYAGGYRVLAEGADRRTPLVAQPPGHVDLADLAVVGILHRVAHAGHRAALRTGLADLVVLAGRLDHAAAFAHVVAHRLLDVHVLAGLNGPDRDQRMPVVRRGRTDQIDRRIVKRRPHVVDDLRFTPLLVGHEFGPPLAGVFVDVDHVQHFGVGPAGERTQVTAAASAATHHGHAQFFVRALARLLFVGQGRGRRTSRHGGSGREHRIFQKLPSGTLRHQNAP